MIRTSSTGGGYTVLSSAHLALSTICSVTKPSSDVLLRLSKALDVRVEYFFRQIEIELEGVEYRKHPQLPKRDERRVLADVVKQLERWLELESFIPSSWPGDRQRFTLAHELGHLILAGRLSDNAELDEERACHRFAGAFLVPREEALRSLGKKRKWLEPREIYLLKHEWGLSMNAWLHRAQDLGIVNKATANQLWRYFRTHGWREKEPDKPYPNEQPKRFNQLVYRALAEDLVGEAKAAELLGIKVTELRARRRMEASD